MKLLNIKHFPESNQSFPPFAGLQARQDCLILPAIVPRHQEARASDLAGSCSEAVSQ